MACFNTRPLAKTGPWVFSCLLEGTINEPFFRQCAASIHCNIVFGPSKVRANLGFRNFGYDFLAVGGDV